MQIIMHIIVPTVRNKVRDAKSSIMSFPAVLAGARKMIRLIMYARRAR